MSNFKIGDIIRTTYGSRRDHIVTDIHLDPDSGQPDGVHFTSPAGWDRFEAVELVAASEPNGTTK